MRDEAKSKNKALHRRLSDILDPDAAQTSKLLGKIKPLSWSFPQTPSSEVIPYPDRTLSDLENTVLTTDTVIDQDTVFIEDTVSSNNTVLLENTVSSSITLSREDTVLTENTVFSENTDTLESTVLLENTVLNENTVSASNTVVTENTVSFKDTVIIEDTPLLQNRVFNEQRDKEPTLEKPEEGKPGNTVSQVNTVANENTVTELDTVSYQNTVSLQDSLTSNDLSLAEIDLDLNTSDQDQKDQKDQIEINANPQYSIRIPYSKDTVSRNATVSDLNTVSQQNTVPFKQGYLEVPNNVADEIARILSPFEWAIYFRLFRLSYGWHKDTCIVGAQSLIEATNTSESQVRRSLKILQEKGLIKVLETINTRDLKGTRYQVFTVSQQNTVSTKDTVSKQNPVLQGNTVSSREPIKDDHDDLLKKDHHQSSHEHEVMMIYKKLTNNSWTKSDTNAYEKVKNIPIQTIEQGIQVTLQRATSRPNSFAYFYKEIHNLASPSQQSRAQLKKALAKIVKSVREVHTGQQGYTIAEFSADVKDACLREGIVFDNDLFNELVK